MCCQDGCGSVIICYIRSVKRQIYLPLETVWALYVTFSVKHFLIYNCGTLVMSVHIHWLDGVEVSYQYYFQ